MADIYMFVERKAGDKWKRVSEKKGINNLYYRDDLPDNLKKVVKPKTWSPGRHYALFGLLAGVKSKQIGAMVPPRGLPDDLSPGVDFAYKKTKNIHTSSYFALDELLAMRDNSVTLTYFLNAEQFRKFKKLGKIPDEDYAYFISAPRTAKLISNDRMTRIMNMDAFMDDNEYITQVDVSTPYKEISPIFWNDIISAMESICKDPTKVRCVFWFDD